MQEAGRAYYFAYGSNMDRTQMSERCPDAVFVDIARLPGYKFMINSRGVATLIAEESGVVYGVLWDITKPCEDSLDSHEGVKYGIYKKSIVCVTRIKGAPASALTYAASDKTPGLPRAGYVEKIINAAKRENLPAEHINQLKTWLPDCFNYSSRL